MAGWLIDKVALVTGAASGIGAAVVERFLGEGARVCALDSDEPRLRGAARTWGDQVVPVPGDVRRWEDNQRAVAAATAAFGRLDILVGNAGVFDGFLRLVDLPPDALGAAFDEILSVNVRGYLLGAQAAAAHLSASQGCMIFTVSSAGLYAGAGGILYTVSKHAVVGLIRQLSHELAPRVRVNGVAPGGTLTGFQLAETLRSFARVVPAEERQERIRRANPLQIVMRPEDHTAAYVLLASDQARSITGTVLASDGGLAARGLWSAPGGGDPGNGGRSETGEGEEV